MCLCILITPEGKITTDRLREAHTANPDGWGVMWSDRKDLFTVKSTKPKPSLYDEILELPRPVVVHFRTASSGGINYKATHPLHVNDNLAFVANGNLFEFSDSFRDWNDGLTDMQRFNDYFLKKHVEKYGFSFLADDDAIELYCKNRMVKMIVMNNWGSYKIINNEAGEWIDGCWFSNGGIENYIGYGYSGAYVYRPGETRHFGGFSSVQTFSSEERSKWSQCQTCFGWFPKEKVNGNCQGCAEWLALMELVK